MPVIVILRWLRVSPRELRTKAHQKNPNQSLNEPTLTELLAQQCFLVAETTASIQFQLDKIISTLNYLVSWATSECPGLTTRQPDMAAGSSLPSLSKSTGQCNLTNSSNSTPLDANSHLVLQSKQGTQGSLVNKPQASASGIPSIYETDLSQDNFWNLEEIQLFDSFCVLPQPERAQIIKRLDAVKSKLWSLSLPDKDPLGFQGVHTNLPAEAPLALSPECLIRKSEDPGLLQTPSADATECLPAKQSINATSTNWSAFRALQPHEQGSRPLLPFLPLSPKRVTLPLNNG
ncbi:hypothetical protein E2320_008049, partial [Naja naja]